MQNGVFMAKKKFISLDEFLNQNPDKRVEKEQKVFLETSLNDKVNLGSIPEVVPGLPADSGVPPEVPQTNITPKIRHNKNRGGKRNLRKFKKIENPIVESSKKPIDTKNFRFPYSVEGMPGDISSEELSRARALLPKQDLSIAQSVVNSNGSAVNASGEEIVSKRRGKNRGGRSGRGGSLPTTHISHAEPAIDLGRSFYSSKSC
jgi:hypothetical protein